MLDWEDLDEDEGNDGLWFRHKDFRKKRKPNNDD